MGLIINPYRYAAPAGPSIPTPWLRYRGDQVALADGASIDYTDLLDISGNARHPTNVNTTKPVLRTNVLNGHAAIDFNPVSGATFFYIPSMSAFTSADVFFIYKANATNINAGGPHNWHGGGFANHWPFSDTTIYDGFFSSARFNSLTPIIALNTWHLIHLRHRSGSAGYQFVQNDMLVHMNTGSFSALSGQHYFGESGAGLAHFRVADLIVYNAWQSGTDLKAIIDYLVSEYALTISNVWTLKKGVSESSGTLTRTAASDTWGGAAASSVVGRTGDCGASYTVAETNKRRCFGLSFNDTGQSYIDVGYAIVLDETGTWTIYESGVSSLVTGSYVTTDVFEVTRSSTNIVYKKNGSTLRTVGSVATTEVFVDVSIYSNGGTIGPITF